MDYRRFFKSESTLLALPSSVVTPQLEDYSLFHGFRGFPVVVYPKDEQPFMLVLNLASVMESELNITRVMKNANQDRDVLQVDVNHKMKAMDGVAPFSRECTYRYILPEKLSCKPLTALWTTDHHLIVVESSNFMGNEESLGVDISDKDPVTTIKPRKVNGMFRPGVNVDVLRHSVALAEHQFFHVKKLIQDNSFVRPDIGRPFPVFEPESTEEDEAEVFLDPRFIADCIENMEHLKNVVEENMEKKGKASAKDKANKGGLCFVKSEKPTTESIFS